MRLELYLDGSEAAIFHYCKEQSNRPDVVRLGDGSLWRFYRYRPAKVGGNIGCQYVTATVADFPQITASKGK